MIRCPILHIRIRETAVENFCYVHGIDTSDAMHILWAIRRSCTYFATTDQRLLRKLKGKDIGNIKLCHPTTLAGIREIQRQRGQRTLDNINA
jgi:hypothetical protein